MSLRRQFLEAQIIELCFQARQVLEANIRILEAFISLMDNSTSQLRRFQVVEELVISKLVHLKRRTKTLINSYLKLIVEIITIVSLSYFNFGLV